MKIYHKKNANEYYLTDKERKTFSQILGQYEQSLKNGNDRMAVQEIGKLSPKLISPEIHFNMMRDLSYEGAGYFIVKNLPSDALRGMSVLVHHWVGIPVKYEGEGQMVITIKPKPGVKETGFANSGAFPGHSDLSYVDVPPQFMSMGVIRQDQEGRGKTIIGDSKKALQKLSKDEMRELAQKQFSFKAPDHFSSQASEQKNKEVLSVDGDSIFTRIREDKISCANPAAMSAFKRYARMMNTQCADEFLLPSNSLIMIDNHRCTHARYAFRPTFDENDRELIRTYGTNSIHAYGDKFILEEYTVCI